MTWQEIQINRFVYIFFLVFVSKPILKVLNLKKHNKCNLSAVEKKSQHNSVYMQLL